MRVVVAHQNLIIVAIIDAKEIYEFAGSALALLRLIAVKLNAQPKRLYQYIAQHEQKLRPFGWGCGETAGQFINRDVGPHFTEFYAETIYEVFSANMFVEFGGKGQSVGFCAHFFVLNAIGRIKRQFCVERQGEIVAGGGADWLQRK